MIRQLEDLNAMVQAWIDRQEADGCGGCAFSGRDSWEQPCCQCKRNAKDFWRKAEEPGKKEKKEKKGIYG